MQLLASQGCTWHCTRAQDAIKAHNTVFSLPSTLHVKLAWPRQIIMSNPNFWVYAYNNVS